MLSFESVKNGFVYKYIYMYILAGVGDKKPHRVCPIFKLETTILSTWKASKMCKLAVD